MAALAAGRHPRDRPAPAPPMKASHLTRVRPYLMLPSAHDGSVHVSWYPNEEVTRGLHSEYSQLLVLIGKL